MAYLQAVVASANGWWRVELSLGARACRSLIIITKCVVKGFGQCLRVAFDDGFF